MWKEFKEFALRGNVLDMAVGIIIGAAFTTVVKSLVDDVIMPPIGLALGDVQFQDMFLQLKAGDPVGSYATLAAAREAGAVVIGYGALVNNTVTFLIVAFVVFLMVKMFNRLRRSEEGASEEETTTRTCPECLSTIPLKASRCAHCTSELAPAA
jgi:large conductance mechanosensitive channel